MEIVNLEWDLFESDIIINKCKDPLYAQHLYAALCNNRFFKDDKEWSCSWRDAGRIVSDLRNCGEDYMDWYCSGIDAKDNSNFMIEGCVNDEIREDLSNLRWTIEPRDCMENN